MEEMARLGELALKLEKYKYNMTASISWIIYGGVFASVFLIGNALIGLFGFNPAVLAASIFGSIVISVYVYSRFTRLVGKFKRGKFKGHSVVFGSIFAVFYFAIPLLIKGSNIFYAAYYSTAWYPALGVAHMVLWYVWQRKDEDLVTKPALIAGPLSLITSVPVMYGVFQVTNMSSVLNLSFLALGLMLAIYMASGLWSFYKSYKVIF